MTELDAVILRLEQLEKANRRLKQTGLMVALLIGSLLVMGQARVSRTVEAERFVLKDTSGRTRADLSMEPRDRPTLTLRDASGYPLVSLAADDNPFLTLSKRNGQQVQLFMSKDVYGLGLYSGPVTRVGLGVWNGVPGLSLYDEKQTERASLDIKPPGPSLTISNAKGLPKAIVGMAEAGEEGALSLFDDRGMLGAGVFVENNGTRFEISDKSGFKTVVGTTDLLTPQSGVTHRTSAASVVLFGKDGKVLWSAP